MGNLSHNVNLTALLDNNEIFVYSLQKGQHTALGSTIKSKVDLSYNSNTLLMHFFA